MPGSPPESVAEPPAPASVAPDAEMIAAAERVARFIEAGGGASIDGMFAEGEVTIVENFPPYLFEGPGAAQAWSRAMRDHLAGAAGLSHSFGPAHDFSRAGERVYFSLPTTWRGASHARPFTESGGWSFVLVRQDGAWRVRGYGWAVTALSRG